MKKLLSLSCYTKELEFLFESESVLSHYLAEHRFSGVEALQLKDWPRSILSDGDLQTGVTEAASGLVNGVHLTWIPIWLDFWRNDSKALLRQFGTQDAWRDFYGGLDKSVLIQMWQEEVQEAIRIGAEYVVFHIGHVELNHCYTYDFTYTSAEVIEESIALVNRIFDKDLIKGNITLLFENLWWPGLTLLEPSLTQQLMQEVHWKDKGIMLDLGHLMNTNLSLKSEDEAILYFKSVIEGMKALAPLIRGVHLNSSLSGDYVMGVKNEFADKPHWRHSDWSVPFMTQFFNAFPHIGKIDEHRWFRSPGLKEWLESLDLEWLVYEFREGTSAEMTEAIIQQNTLLNV